VRETLLDALRCPACHADRALALARTDENGARETREGALACERCGHRAEIRRGVVDLLHKPPEFVAREAAGLGRFAERMRRDGWGRERILNLPHEPDGYWMVQSTSMDQLLSVLDLRPGQRLVDLGSNTCWASAIFAQRGLDVIALDISTHEMQGLYTADWWFEGRGVYFERVLGTMFDLPLADESLDYVFACEVLHHNDRRTLRRTMDEAFRVLRPGGRLLVLNETMRFPLEPKLRPGREVAEYEGYEHAFAFATYYAAARRAGLRRERLLGPIYHRFFWEPAPRSPVWRALRRSRAGRRAYAAWLTLVRGGVQLSVVFRKPAEPS